MPPPPNCRLCLFVLHVAVAIQFLPGPPWHRITPHLHACASILATEQPLGDSLIWLVGAIGDGLLCVSRILTYLLCLCGLIRLMLFFLFVFGLVRYGRHVE